VTRYPLKPRPHGIARLAGAFAVMAMLYGSAWSWPDRPIQMLVGYPPGGVIDVMARSAAEALAQTLKQPVVVVNKDGAGGTIAAAMVAKAPADGYTIAFSTLGPLNLQPHLKKTLPYKPEELVGICQAFYNDLAVVASPKSRYNSLADVIAEAKKNPDKVSYGVPGNGTVPHIGALQLAQSANIKMQAVAYKGDPAVNLALKTGEIELGVMATGSALSQGLRLLAVLSPERVKEAPSVPTATELGYPALGQVSAGLYGPRNLPPAIKSQLEGACKIAVGSDKYVAAAKAIQVNATYTDGEAFDKTIVQTSNANRQVIQAAGLSLDN